MFLLKQVVLITSLFSCSLSLEINEKTNDNLRKGDNNNTPFVKGRDINSMYNVDIHSILRNISHLNSVEYFSNYIKPTENAYYSIETDIFVNHLKTLSNRHLHLNQKQSNASFSCQRISTSFDPTILCSGIVDYSFIVPLGSTAAELNKVAISSVQTLNSFMPTACLSDLKRLTCASVYLKCVENVIPDNFATYALTNVSTGSNIQIPLPFERPCKSLCTAVTYMGKSCGGILEALGAAPNCLQTTPSLYFDVTTLQLTPITLSFFDSSNSKSCNSVASSASLPLVAQATEPYIGTICKGLVSEILVPSSATVDKSFAPLQPPFVLQTIQEKILSVVESYIPRYLTKDCLQAQRAVMCSLFFLTPFPSNQLSFLFGTVYLPSFPNRNICQNYAKSCPVLIAASPSAAINCSGTIPGTSIKLFPTANQTIVSLPLGYFTVDLQSPPHSIVPSSSYVEITTECPYGFVVPEDLSKKSIVWATGTGCAFACPSAFIPPSEYDYINSQYSIGLWVTYIVYLMQLINMYVLKPSKRNVFIIIIIVMNLSNIVYIIRNLIAKTFSDTICDSNASWYTYAGRFESANSFMCTVIAFVNLIMSFLSYWCLMALSIEIWIRVVLGVKDVRPYKRYYFFGPLIVVLANLFVIIFYGHGSDVLIPGVPLYNCLWVVPDNAAAMYTQTIPLICYFGVAIILIGHSLYYILRTSLRVAGADVYKTLRGIWKSYGMLFTFMILYSIVYFPVVLIVLVDSVVYYDSFVKSGGEWITCLITNFTTSSDNSYLAKCGITPAVRPGQGNALYILATFYILSFSVFYLTMTADVKAFWWNLIVRFLDLIYINKLISTFGDKDGKNFNLKAVKRQRVSIYSGNSDELDSDKVSSTVSTKPVLKRIPTNIEDDEESTIKENKQDVISIET